MKFLIHIPQLIYGGAEKVLVNFANCLIEHGHDVEILETYEKGYLKPQFDNRVSFNAICSKEYTKKYYASLQDVKSEHNLIYKAKKVGKLAFSKIVGYRAFAEKLAAKYYKDKHYDVAINYLEIEDPAFIMHNIDAGKYIQWIHIDALKLKTGELDTFIPLYKKMDAVICVAETARASLCGIYPSLNNNTYVIYNFFDIDNIKNKAIGTSVYETKSINILSVGRMVEQKGYLRALKVIKRLKGEGYNFTWYIMGDGGDRQKIEEYIKEHQLEKKVRLLGLKDNPYPYIKQCDLFFLPSLYEGFPTVTIEAKVLGKPVLATEVSGIHEQLVSGKHGLIVENSEKGLYEGLKYILDNPHMLLKYSSSDGMQSVLDNSIKYKKFMKLVNITGGLYEHNVLR